MDDAFELAFKRYASNLKGTEAEITVYKSEARRWFDLGMKEGALIVHSEVSASVQRARAACDTDWAFTNNIK